MQNNPSSEHLIRPTHKRMDLNPIPEQSEKDHQDPFYQLLENPYLKPRYWEKAWPLLKSQRRLWSPKVPLPAKIQRQTKYIQAIMLQPQTQNWNWALETRRNTERGKDMQNMSDQQSWRRGPLYHGMPCLWPNPQRVCYRLRELYHHRSNLPCRRPSTSSRISASGILYEGQNHQWCQRYVPDCREIKLWHETPSLQREIHSRTDDCTETDKRWAKTKNQQNNLAFKPLWKPNLMLGTWF